jgi:hypothetical protein
MEYYHWRHTCGYEGSGFESAMGNRGNTGGFKELVFPVPGQFRHDGGGSRAPNEAFQRHPYGEINNLDTGSRFKPGTGFTGMTPEGLLKGFAHFR